MIKAILFDIDGTLLNTSELIFQAFEYALKTHKYPGQTREFMGKSIGKSLEDCYLDFAPNGDPVILSKTHNQFQLKNPQLAEIFPETIPTLEKLKSLGLKLAGITNRWKSSGELSIKHTGLDKFLEFVLFRDDVKKLKPNPEPIFQALEVLGVKPEEAIMVGDSEVDIECGKNAAVLTVGVTFGFGGKDIAKFKPDFMVDSLGGLERVLVSYTLP